MHLVQTPINLVKMPHKFDCGAFDCGKPEMNHALRNSLPAAIEQGRSVAYYLERCGKWLGFISLRAESFEVDAIDRDNYALSNPTIPGVLLELLAVDITEQKQGLGDFLLFAAIGIGKEVSEKVGARFLVLDSVPEKVKFYEKRQFKPTYIQPTDTQTVSMVFDLLS